MPTSFVCLSYTSSSHPCGRTKQWQLDPHQTSPLFRGRAAVQLASAAADGNFKHNFDPFATNFDNANFHRCREGVVTNGGAGTLNCEGGDATLMICKEGQSNDGTTTLPRDKGPTMIPCNDGTITMAP
jgi:hypothetical protein